MTTQDHVQTTPASSPSQHTNDAPSSIADDDMESLTEQDRTPEESATAGAWGQRLEGLGHLYRYIGLRGERFAWFVDMALRSVLYFPPFKALNDPFDGATQLVYDGTEEEIKTFWYRRLAENGTTPTDEDHARIANFVAGAHDPAIHRQMRSFQDEATAKLGVACFSEIADHLPMWAYYAEAHRGLCLRFRTDLLWRPKWDRCEVPMPVTYEDAYPEVAFYRDSRFRRADAVIATKAGVWSHEQEWRLVRETFGPVKFNPAALDGVVMGCRIDPDDEARVRAVLARRDPPVELLKAREGEREFRLVIEASD